MKPSYVANPGVGSYLLDRSNSKSKYGLKVLKENHPTFGDENRFKDLSQITPGPGNYEHEITDNLKLIKDLFSPRYQ